MKKNSEILLNKNDKCLFSYLDILTLTAKGFRAIYFSTKASNMETTVSKECDNYIIQMLKTCENAYQVTRYFSGYLQALQNRTKRFIFEERQLYWEFINGILLQLA